MLTEKAQRSSWEPETKRTYDSTAFPSAAGGEADQARDFREEGMWE
jgi:hypothetical protein